MRNFLFVLLACFSSASVCAQHLAKSGNQYRLKKIIPVSGRQGIAVDKDFYYVSSSTALYKYDKQGNLLMKNETPFKGLAKAANHFGDIDVFEGKLYTGIEWFVDGQGKDIQIAIYDAKTLQYETSIDFDPMSGQVEVCGVAIDRERKQVWLADWVNGRYVYRYDLTNGQYQAKLHLRPAPQYQQGIFYADGHIIIAADDGDADLHETDNLYRVNVENSGQTSAYVTLFREMKDFKRAGEIEGLSVDPVNDDLLVLSNRGSRIVLGMVKGFYEGYTNELHELYVYERLR